MELDTWIRQEMKRFIRMQAPKEARREPTRPEEARGLDYEGTIRKALEQNRYEEATRLFKELRETFEQVPIEHQQERKRYYHLLQRSYKEIYDYVAERHKTVRILQQMSYNADVFDEQVPSVDPSQIHNEALPLPSIEQAMRKHREDDNEDGIELPPMPQFDPKTGMRVDGVALPKKEPPRPTAPAPAPDAPKPAPERGAATKEAPQPQPQKAAPVAAQRPMLPKLKPLPEPRTAPRRTVPRPAQTPVEPLSWEPPKLDDAPKKERRFERPEPEQLPESQASPEPEPTSIKEVLALSPHDAAKRHPEHAPAWRPPHLEPRAPARQPPAPTSDGKDVRRAATAELIERSQRAIEEGDNDAAQQLLLEARFELLRAGEPKDLQHQIQALEAHLAHSLMPDLIIPEDVELFSSAYLKGLEAMARGNYQAAITFFRSRVLQTPRDRAARIRLTECLEVMHGQSA